MADICRTMDEADEATHNAAMWRRQHEEEWGRLTRREKNRIMSIPFRTRLPVVELLKMDAGEMLALWETLEAR